MTPPTVLNIICPQCTLTWLCKGENHYTCLACGYVLIERVAQNYVNSIAQDKHKVIYI